MKKYVKPTMQIEKIEMNQAIASCDNGPQGYCRESEATAFCCYSSEIVANVNLEEHNANKHRYDQGANSHVPAYRVFDKDGNAVGYYVPGSGNKYQGNGNLWNVQPFTS